MSTNQTWITGNKYDVILSNTRHWVSTNTITFWEFKHEVNQSDKCQPVLWLVTVMRVDRQEVGGGQDQRASLYIKELWGHQVQPAGATHWIIPSSHPPPIVLSNHSKLIACIIMYWHSISLRSSWTQWPWIEIGKRRMTKTWLRLILRRTWYERLAGAKYLSACGCINSPYILPGMHTRTHAHWDSAINIVWEWYQVGMGYRCSHCHAFALTRTQLWSSPMGRRHIILTYTNWNKHGQNKYAYPENIPQKLSLQQCNECHASYSMCAKHLLWRSIQLREVVRCKQRQKGTEDQKNRKEIGNMHQAHKIHSRWGKFRESTFVEKD